MPRQVELARQVEYYFTKQNLSTDTYLQRLRQLNDGCVPISILVNFSRVRAMSVPSNSNREKYIVDAISKNSTTLAVYSINTKTGKRQDGTADDSAANSIQAIGLATEGEHPPDTVGLALIEKEGMDATDTIILRDVHPTVTEEEVRSLFEAIEGCPPVLKMCPDVAQCWFVTLDTRDRTDMMKVMLAVRSMKYPSTGEYVLARLKASSLSVAQVQPIRRGRRKRRGKRSKKATSESPASSIRPGSVMKSIASLPSLTSDQFPALQYNTFEWETAPTGGRYEDDDDATKGDPKSLDAASTATTTSSTATNSSVEKQGYAAVLMKPATGKGSVPPAVQESSVSSNTSKTTVLEWSTNLTSGR